MKRKGFTLVEILAVILVIAVILAIIVPNISNFVLQRQNDNFITAARSLSRELVYDNLEYTSFSVSKLREKGMKFRDGDPDGDSEPMDPINDEVPSQVDENKNLDNLDMTEDELPF